LSAKWTLFLLAVTLCSEVPLKVDAKGVVSLY